MLLDVDDDIGDDVVVHDGVDDRDVLHDCECDVSGAVHGDVSDLDVVYVDDEDGGVNGLGVVQVDEGEVCEVGDLVDVQMDDDVRDDEGKGGGLGDVQMDDDEVGDLDNVWDDDDVSDLGVADDNETGLEVALEPRDDDDHIYSLGTTAASVILDLVSPVVSNYYSSSCLES